MPEVEEKPAEFLLRFLKRYRIRYFAGFVLSAMSAVFAVLTPLFIKRGIEGLEAGQGKDFIRFIALAVASFGLIRSVLLYLGRNIIVNTGRMVERDMRDEVLRNTLFLKTRSFEETGTGNISSQIINDVEHIRMFLSFGGMIISHILPVFLFSILMEFIIHPILTTFAVIPLCVISVVVLVSQRKIFDASERVQEKLSEISEFSEEKISAIRVIKNFVVELPLINMFSRISESYKKESVGLAKQRGIFEGAIIFLAELSLLSVLLIGGVLVIKGEVSKGTLAGFIAYQLLLIWPSMAIGYLFVLLERGLACASRLQKLYRGEKEISPDEIRKYYAVRTSQNTCNYPDERTTQKKEKMKPKEIGGHNIAYSIKIDGLSYKGILKNISLFIPEGKKVGIIGETGSGKTTLLNLIARLYEPPKGKIFIGEKDITEIPLAELRDSIAYVMQDKFFFSTTIKENILVGLGDRKLIQINGASIPEIISGIPDNFVMNFLKIAHFDPSEFPNGIYEVVGERGVKLSGGQKDRISLARALIKVPRILLLDDPFANVDLKTEEKIIQDLMEFSEKNRITVVLATHRALFLRYFDLIITLKEGKIVESGEPDELLKEKGSFFRRCYEIMSDWFGE